MNQQQEDHHATDIVILVDDRPFERSSSIPPPPPRSSGCSRSTRPGGVGRRVVFCGPGSAAAGRDRHHPGRSRGYRLLAAGTALAIFFGPTPWARTTALCLQARWTW